MSGGPPHHPHNRQVPTANPAWNHLPASLQVPNFFPRQPQLAHMSNEHSLLHQPTWHTPTTTDAMKMLPHSHMFNEMLKNESLFPKDCVDLSLARNGNQNGELPSTPISLSVRDANKINSLPPSALDIQAVELTKCNSPLIKPASPGLMSVSPSLKSVSPGLKSASPGLIPGLPSSPGLKASRAHSPGIKGTGSISPGLKSVSPGLKCDSPGPKLDSFGLMKPMSPSVSTSALPLPQCPPFEILNAQQKRAHVRVDSILERLNPFQPEKAASTTVIPDYKPSEECVDKIHLPQFAMETVEKPVSVIVQPPGGSCDENSNSNSISNVPRDEDTVSSNSNEDSLDSNKSRRKRKPCKTIRVSKDDDKLEDKLSVICEGTESSVVPKEQSTIDLRHLEKDPISLVGEMLGEESKIPERRRSSDDLEELIPAKTRRKTSSESETIDNIAAMVQDCLKEKKMSESLVAVEKTAKEPESKPISVSVIKTKEKVSDSNSLTSFSAPLTCTSNPTMPLITPAQKKATNTHFVEVENKLEEMFAGIEDSSDPLKTDALDLDESKFDDSLSKLDDSLQSKLNEEEEPHKEEAMEVEDIPKEEVEEATKDEIKEIIDDQSKKTSQEDTIVSEATKKKPPSPKKSKRKIAPSSRRSSDATSAESTPKKKKPTKKMRSDTKATKGKAKTPKKSTISTSSVASIAAGTQATQKAVVSSKIDAVKDVYAYDSGSNASSSKSRGPYIQIKGPRDSPLSVNVVNTPINDDDGERKMPKSKKFHDDLEYRHKVRSKGLHSSTLSNKYDAQTKDTTWICVFCKRGPHASELTGPTSDGDVVPPGDLFGPYFITNECPEFERRFDDPFDKQFKSKKITRCLNESGLLVRSPASSLKKSKRKQSDADSVVDGGGDLFLGIIETDKKTYEIWAHEDCIVWSPGVYLVGHKIVGLEEAVWTSCNVPCRNCHLKGANICCLRRGCMNTMHLCCARANRWRFDEAVVKAYCPQHAIP